VTTLAVRQKIKMKSNWVSISWCMCPLTRNSFGFIFKIKILGQPTTNTWWQQPHTGQSVMPKSILHIFGFMIFTDIISFSHFIMAIGYGQLFL